MGSPYVLDIPIFCDRKQPAPDAWSTNCAKSHGDVAVACGHRVASHWVGRLERVTGLDEWAQQAARLQLVPCGQGGGRRPPVLLMAQGAGGLASRGDG
jgi:hypothetical protein